jgi:hypothetical protein
MNSKKSLHDTFCPASSDIWRLLARRHLAFLSTMGLALVVLRCTVFYAYAFNLTFNSSTVIHG